MQGDYWRAKKDLKFQAADYFNNVTKNERDMMNNTKNFVMRHRLNRDIDFTDDFRKRFMTKEYGNYDKYEKNSISLTEEDGKDEINEDKMYENYMNLLKRLPTKEADEIKQKKKEDIKDMVMDKNYAHG